MIKFCYYNGSKTKSETKVEKGWSIAKFLERAKKPIAEIKRVDISKLLFIKEELIVPHHFTFYDLITARTKGRNGVLIEFGPNASEKSTMPWIVDRQWFEANKHIFPANRWLTYDPLSDQIEQKNEKI